MPQLKHKNSPFKNSISVSLVKCQHIGKCKCNITLNFFFNLIGNIFKNTLTRKKSKKKTYALGFEPRP